MRYGFAAGNLYESILRKFSSRVPPILASHGVVSVIARGSDSEAETKLIKACYSNHFHIYKVILKSVLLLAQSIHLQKDFFG